MQPKITPRIPNVTVHGRFQPPLHVNHWDYIRQAFDRAQHVSFLITNPYNDETFDAAAAWRNDPANNPFSYEERVFMLGAFFNKRGIDPSRYNFTPFNIKNPAAFKQLDKHVPNLINVYSEWSAKKADEFQKNGLSVIRLAMPKSVPVSGTLIREIISQPKQSKDQLALQLQNTGFMPEAIPGLFEVLASKGQL